MVVALGVLGAIAGGVIGVAASDHAGTATPAASPAASPVAAPTLTLDDVVAALTDAGLAVEATDQTVEQPFFTVSANIIRVEGQDLQVFVYASTAARSADSEQISADGTSVGTSMITWIAAPHFTTADNVLALFVSNDEALARRIADAISGVSAAKDATPVASPQPEGGA